VRGTGLEPARIAPYAPQAYASTNFATRAYLVSTSYSTFYLIKIPFVFQFLLQNCFTICKRKKKLKIAKFLTFRNKAPKFYSDECPREDLNLYKHNAHSVLNAARLPVPPRGLDSTFNITSVFLLIWPYFV
jgi:hypothetical protein